MNNPICGDCGGPLDVREEEQTPSVTRMQCRLSVTCMQCGHSVSQTLQAAGQASYADRIAELMRVYDVSRPSVMAPLYLKEYQEGTSLVKEDDVQHWKDDGMLPSPAWQPLFDAMGVK